MTKIYLISFSTGFLLTMLAIKMASGAPTSFFYEINSSCSKPKESYAMLKLTTSDGLILLADGGSL